MSAWVILGLVSLAWSGLEVLTGEAWLHRSVRRSEEPLLFSAVASFWALLGLSCLAPLVL